LLQVHSFRGLSCYMSVAPSRASSPVSAIWCFFLKVIHWLLTSSSSSSLSLFPSMTCFRSSFYSRCDQYNYITFHFIVYRMFLGFWWRNLRERDHWGDPDVDGRITLRLIFGKWEGVVGTGWS